MFRDIPLHPSSSIVQAMQSPRESIKLMEASLKPPLLTTTLFLGDLSVVCTEMSLRELFSKYGELERVQLKKSDRDPQRAHLGFGFVKFSTRESAERALEELNGKFFLGRALRVGWADDHNRIGVIKASDPKKNHQTAQLHVSFTSHADKIVSEMDLGGVFSGFGNVVDIAIKKNVLNRESGVQSGYAFVHFSLTLAGLQSALTASERVNNCTIDDITYKCKTDQALVMQYMSLKSSEPSSPHNDFSRASSPAMHDFVRAPSPVFRDYSRAPSPASRDFAHAPSPRAPSPAFRDFSRAPSPATHDFVRAPSHDYANAPSSTFLAGVADPREPLTRLEDGIVCSKPKPIPYPLTFPSYDKTLESPRMSSYESPRINSYHEHKGENLTSPARHTFKTYGGDRTPPTGHSKAGVFTFPSVSRSCSSSLKENDYQSTVLYPSLSISSSVSYDEYPSYRRGGIMKDFYYPTIQE